MRTRSACNVFLTHFLCFVGAVVVLLPQAAAGAQSPPLDVGLITKLSGEATYWDEASQKTPRPAQIFMKIRKGDHLKMASGTSLEIVFFQGGRKETWQGPTVIIAEETGSRAESESATKGQVAIAMLPSEASQGLRRIPALLDQARLGRSGGIQVRGPGEGVKKTVVPGKKGQTEIARAREVYQRWRGQTSPDDITPELNFLGTLAQYQQYGEMEKVVQNALERQPDNGALKELEQWVQGKLGKSNQ
ncbi:MAG TPA: hypothetical protein VMU60_01280 [Syntrophobacteria bacterium]|nr:hypothetical protein [Syntrophobacteria bacterium]